MTDTIQCDDPEPHPVPSRPRSALRWGIPAIIFAALLSGGVVWWLQEARVQAREAARAEAAAQLEKTVGLLKVSEATAAAAAEQLKQAKAAVEAAGRQAAEATAQLDTVRRDAAGARTERDQAKAALATARGDLDRARANDADPGLLPVMELGKVFGGLRQVRASTALQLGRGVDGLDPGALDATLASSLAATGFTVGPQSPFRVRLLVTGGREEGDTSLGVLMLVMRVFKVPGEAASREVAIWGQQRTSHAGPDNGLAQVQSMVGDLCRELGAAAGVPPAAAAGPAPVPAATPAPVAPAPNGPKS